MAKNKPKTVNTLINDPKGDVQFLMHRLSTITALKEELPQFLDENSAQHCRVVNLRNNTLVIAVSSSIWVNKLRFKLPDLLTSFRSAGFTSLSKIELIVRPE